MHFDERYRDDMAVARAVDEVTDLKCGDRAIAFWSRYGRIRRRARTQRTADRARGVLGRIDALIGRDVGVHFATDLTELAAHVAAAELRGEAGDGDRAAARGTIRQGRIRPVR